MRKFLFFFLVLFFLLTPKTVLALAQQPPFTKLDASQNAWYGNPNKSLFDGGLNSAQQSSEVNSESAISSAVKYSMFAIGDIFPRYDSSGKLVGNGITNLFASSIGNMISAPAVSSSEYIAYFGSKIKIPGTPDIAYASNGTGYQQLQPVLGLWTLARNLAYLAFSVVFVVLGFMIIFRVKVDPKTVLTIQSAIPKIIMSLILITFSYAIAGFIIDIMYLLIAFVFGLFANGAGGISPSTYGAITFMLAPPKGESPTIFHLMSFLSDHTTAKAGIAFGEVVQQFLTNTDTGKLNLLGFTAAGIAWLVITVAILWALFKTWITLLTAYVQIILGVVTAPLFLMVEAFPGQGAFGKWLRGMFANILVFPFVVLMALAGSAVIDSYKIKDVSDGFVAPFLGAANQQSIQALIGLGMILILPKAINILQDFIKAPPFKYGNAWQDAIKASTGFVGGNASNLGRSGYNNVVGDAQKQWDEFESADRKAKLGVGTAPLDPGWAAKTLGRLPKIK